MREILYLIVLGTAIWLAIDSSRLNAIIKSRSLDKRGIGSPVLWFFSCIVLWIIIFPLYLYYRSKLKRELEDHSDDVQLFKNEPRQNPTSDEVKYVCGECNAEVPAEAKFCPKCGSKFIDKEEEVSENTANNQNASTETPNNNTSLEESPSEIKPKRYKWLFFTIPVIIIIIFIIIFVNTKKPTTINPQVNTQVNPQINTQPVSESIKYSNFNFSFVYPKNAEFQEKGYSLSAISGAKSEKELLEKSSGAVTGTPNSNSGYITIIWYDRSIVNVLGIIWMKCIQLEQVNIERFLSKGMRGLMLTPGYTNFQIREKGSIYWTIHPSVGNVKYQAFSYDIDTMHFNGIYTIVLCPANQRLYIITYISEHTNPLSEFEKFSKTFKCHLE